MSLRRVTVTAAATAGLALACMVGGSGTAFAGSNGQQIDFVDTLGVANTIRIGGYNQSGQYVSQCFPTPNHENPDSGWWWSGTVNVITFLGHNCETTTANHEADVYIPPQQSGDWVTVSDVNFGGFSG
ncbi:hypothetical protein ABH931_002415 [Streptacidiphilus sp. MAP12-33]|uniref:hypothetical protein n=1 Tax=Streptacidiphilus sp. MAP12-33 TaxID=3156266 RepID=UPI003517DDF3